METENKINNIENLIPAAIEQCLSNLRAKIEMLWVSNQGATNSLIVDVSKIESELSDLKFNSKRVWVSVLADAIADVDVHGISNFGKPRK
jgi:hypothetical protein